jgi:hypothetical protein
VLEAVIGPFVYVLREFLKKHVPGMVAMTLRSGVTARTSSVQHESPPLAAIFKDLDISLHSFLASPKVFAIVKGVTIVAKVMMAWKRMIDRD